jgi:hypothetical protein
MAAIFREFVVSASPGFVWSAIRDFGAVHERLARGFVVNTVVDGNARTVTFANGFVVRELILAIDDEHRRLAYSAVGGRTTHHNAYFQVFEHTPTTARLVWVTDLLPEEMRPAIEQMVDQGILAIQQTLAASFAAATSA